MTQQFQTFQAVKVVNETLEHHGQAGTVRSSAYDWHDAVTDTTRTVVDVMIDGEAETVAFSPEDLQAL